MTMIGNYLIDESPVMPQLHRCGPHASGWMGFAPSDKLDGRIYIFVLETGK
jgi:hypothetical protein